jgi:hypothetical protein
MKIEDSTPRRALKRRGPSFADIALAGAIVLVLVLSWHGVNPR